MHFSLEISHPVATISIILTRINWPNFSLCQISGGDLEFRIITGPRALEPLGGSSPDFVCASSVVVARSSSGGVATCDTLCTSGFMDDVKFGRNGPYGDSGGAITGRGLMSI